MYQGKNTDQTAFHLHLLMGVIDFGKYPFIKLVIENGVSKSAYEDMKNMLQFLQDQYDKQLADGLLDFSSLLQVFQTRIPGQLPINETIIALYDEGIHGRLMAEFMHIKKKNAQENSRLYKHRRKRK